MSGGPVCEECGRPALPGLGVLVRVDGRLRHAMSCGESVMRWGCDACDYEVERETPPPTRHVDNAGFGQRKRPCGGTLHPVGCGARMVAMGVPNHTHVCTGPHDAGDCYCTACGRHFWHAQEALGERGGLT